jgi:hypothetical protein
MDELHYHPVVIFGSSNSGKSSLLGSLFSYFQIEAAASIGIFLGEPFLPVETGYGRWAMEEAEAFFYKGVQEFLDGKAHAATKSRYPFFIPIRIVPKNLPEIRFAFMESNGEWYKPRRNTGRYFPQLKAEINSVMMNYQKGISFIHLAPYTQIDVWSEKPKDAELDRSEISDANLALIGAFNAYENVRAFKTDDAHIFLMTKWDACGKNNGQRPIEDWLMNVEKADLETAIKGLYLKGFTAFNNINIRLDQKAQMQYCSGIMSGRDIIRANSEFRQILNRYPQTMWNWLYANATRCHSEIGKAKTLLPRPAMKAKSLGERLQELIDKVLS